MNSVLPEGYRPILDQRESELAIKLIKDFFERNLAAELRLSRVTSPLFVPRGSGINDDLNGIERPVRFPVKNLGEKEMEVVQSLAKWKRMALADYQYKAGYGLYTDMNALRPDDDIDATHSIYVDQWDWELVMEEGQRSRSFLYRIVTRIYEVLRRTEFLVCEHYPAIRPELPEEIHIVHAEELARRWPDIHAQEREYRICKEKGAVFICGIGAVLSDGAIHGGRAPDYDDWSSPGEDGLAGLNGDIMVWDGVRKEALELSSMGIRVNREALLSQLEIRGAAERATLYWHTRLLSGEFPQTIGGGIGQSRLCMYLLRKAHIGEVQASVWDEETLAACKRASVPLL